MADLSAHGYISIEEHDVEEGVLAPRGWSMRHGRRRRLAAAEVPCCHGEAVALCRGRSVFKRSANKGQRKWDGKGTWVGKREQDAYEAAKLRRLHFTSLRAEYASKWASSATEWLAELQWESFSENSEFEEAWLDQSCEQDSLDTAEDVEDSYSSCGSTVSTVASSAEACSKLSPERVETPEALSVAAPDSGKADMTAYLQVGRADAQVVISQHAQLSPWERAVQRAEVAAKSYFSEPTKAAPRDGVRVRKKIAKHYEEFPCSDEHKALLGSLKDLYDIKTTYNRPGMGEFEAFRWEFFKRHADTFCSGLSRCLGAQLQLYPAPLFKGVGESLRCACQGELQGTLVPALHGTHENNLASIYKNGLVIPGKGNGVKVTNGSSYGVGIYTASMAGAAMSRGYARGSNPPVLVCGVLDCMHESEVRHAGGALVIFDDRRVAPLFVARRRTAALPAGVLPRPRVIANPLPPTPLRRGPAKQLRRRRAETILKLVGAAGFLTRRAARRRFGPSDLRSSIAAEMRGN